MSTDDNNSREEPSYQRMSEREDRQITLTIPELLFIDDNVSLMIDGKEFESMMPLKPAIPSSILLVPIDFIDKIGKALLDLVLAPKTSLKIQITIKVSEMELYLLREICFSRVEYFGHKVGLSLKKKVLHALHGRKKKDIDLLEQLLKDIDLGEN
jgi:hypothetical protein